MLVVAFVSFSLFNFVGDPINNMVGEETSDEERAELRETLGLMDPIHVQFSRFIVNASKGEFGISYQLRRPVSELIVERLPANWYIIRSLYRHKSKRLFKRFCFGSLLVGGFAPHICNWYIIYIFVCSNLRNITFFWKRRSC